MSKPPIQMTQKQARRYAMLLLKLVRYEGEWTEELRKATGLTRKEEIDLWLMYWKLSAIGSGG